MVMKAIFFNGLMLMFANLIIMPVFAQTSGPRKAPATKSTTPPVNQERTIDADTRPSGNTITINGVDVTLVELVGSAAGQTVTATMLIKNPGGNIEICTQNAYAVDTDGNEYNAVTGMNNCKTLYTDIPLKSLQSVKGVPSKVKNIALFKFNLNNRTKRKIEIVEFRNLPINWQ